MTGSASRLFLVLVLLSTLTMVSRPARAFETEPFLTACVYGTLAGTLVGTASLAFTQKPGDHFERIARGASLGLYAGIALGLYVGSLPGESRAASVLRDLQIGPTISPRGLDGAQANYAILHF